jgi:hypothetical protein
MVLRPRKAMKIAMTKKRTLLSYVGTLWLVTVSQSVSAQPAPRTPAVAPAAAPAAPAASPYAPAPPTDASPTTAPTPASQPNETKAGAAFGGTATFGTEANAAMPAPSPAAVPAPPPPVEPAPAPSAATESNEAPLPTKFAVAKSGWLQIGVLFQPWFIVEDAKGLVEPRVDNTNAKSTWDTTATFRFRRAQIKLSGDVVKDTVGYFILFDLAKTVGLSSTAITQSGSSTVTGYKVATADTSPLLDFGVTYKSKFVDVTVGQWKTPISYEGTTSSSELLLPERSYVARYFGDYYDQGIKAEKKFEYLKYSLQVLDGVTGSTNKGSTGAGTVVTGMSRTNQLDNNRQKDLALRLEFTPVKGIMVGGAGLTSVGQRDTQQSTHDIVEGDVEFNYEGLIARGEFLWGWQGKTGSGFSRTKSRGMVGSIGYTIAKKIQPVGRIGYLDVDATTVAGDANSQPLYDKFGSWYKTDEIRSYEFGVNYFIDGKFAKVQAAYAYLDFDNKMGNTPHRQQFILSGQVAF